MKKSQGFNKPRAIALPGGEGIQARKLILKRLKPPPNLGGSRLKSWWQSLRLLLNLFRRAELVREVAPGQAPLPEHAWRDPPAAKVRVEVRL